MRAAAAAAVLTSMGVAEDKAQDLATLARRSMMSFRRSIAALPEFRRPAWGQAPEGRKLVPALLAGAWNDSDRSAADRDVVAELARRPYEDVNETLVRWKNEADPPLHRVGDVWLLVSREDAWSQLAPYVTTADIRLFQNVVLKALGTPDPRFDLPIEDRWLAGVRDQGRPHSYHLCRGMAETLAVMGSRGNRIRLTAESTMSDFASGIVRELLCTANRDWRIWASIGFTVPSFLA